MKLFPVPLWLLVLATPAIADVTREPLATYQVQPAEPAVFIANYLLGTDDEEIIHFLDDEPAK